jgi:hypothetical protein
MVNMVYEMYARIRALNVGKDQENTVRSMFSHRGGFFNTYQGEGMVLANYGKETVETLKRDGCNAYIV